MFASNVTHIHRRGISFLMMLILLLMPLLSQSNMSVRAAPAYTEVGGPIISDTTWTLTNSPYIVVANVEVWQGVTLTIQPGVMVKFNKDKLLQVNGTLIARGTAANPITFTSNQASPQKGDWKNIQFSDGSVDATLDGAGSYAGGSILEYCVVEYGGNIVEYGKDGTYGAIQTDKASPLIDHCAVRNNNSSGVWAVAVSGSPITIRNNTVSGNSAPSSGGGINAYHSTVAGNTVSGNSAGGFGGGIFAETSTVTGNTVSGNSAGDFGGGIYADSSTVMSNTVSDNSAYYGGGIRAASSPVTGNTVSGNSARYSGGGIIAGGSPVTGNTVSGNSTSYGGGGGIWADSSPVTGNIVSGNSTSYGYGGGIYAGGSPVTGNIVSGNSTSYGSGGGIHASESTVMSNTVSGNSAGGWEGGGGIYTYSSSAMILYNTIVGNTAISPAPFIGGVDIEGTPQFQHNNLYGNANYDLAVLSTEDDISGTLNYWGTVATADIQAHIYDWYDHAARGKLFYIPYLQDPDPDAPVPPPQNLRANFTDGSASLSWDAIPSTTTGYGYKVYYDTDASGPPYNGADAAQGDSPIDVGNATQFTLSGWGSGVVYVAITAYDTPGRESWYSNEVSRPWQAYLPAVLKRQATGMTHAG